MLGYCCAALVSSKTRAVLVLAVTFGLVLAFLVMGPASAANGPYPPPVQIFYIPGAEADIFLDFDTINASAVEPVNTAISISAAGNDTYLYYDHWEDGYENVINNPAVSTTLVLGNMDLSDGCAAEFFSPPVGSCTDASEDAINSGNILVFNNAVDINTPLNLDFDGRDKIAASKSVAVTRVGWPANTDAGTGTVLAGAWEVYDTASWESTYDIPVGVTTANQSAMFQVASLHIIASEDNTAISDSSGLIAGCENLGEGDTCYVQAVDEGEQITSGDPSKPIQVHLLTGDAGSQYESRWYTLLPTDLWSPAYVGPVGTYAPGGTACTIETDVFLYNPHGTPLSYSCTNTAPASGSIPAGGTVRVQVDADSAFRCSADDIFAAVSTADSGTGTGDGNSSSCSSGVIHDWGYSVIPESSMSPQVLTGFAVGQDPFLPRTENGAPLWVTTACAEGTFVYVDWDNDGVPDPADTNGDGAADSSVENGYPLSQYEQLRLFQPDAAGVPQGQTGAFVYALSASGNPASPSVGCDLAVVWGQDPRVASVSAPALDVGTGIPPLPLFYTNKGVELVIDQNQDSEIGPGDTIRYTINVINQSRVPVPDIFIYDVVPVNTTYVLNSTEKEIGGGWVPVPDDGSGTPFPLDTLPSGIELAPLGELPVNGTWSVRFEVLLDPIVTLPSDYYDSVRNCSITDYRNFDSEACVDLDLASGDWGDLPDNSYQTSKANNGAVHAIAQSGSGLWLGDPPDAEPSGNPVDLLPPNNNPNNPFGDNALNLADEQGIAFTGTWADGSGEIVATVAGDSGCLNAWMDFTNNNGDLGAPDADFFDDDPPGAYDSVNGLGGSPTEWIIQNEPVSPGANPISFTLPSNLDVSVAYYLRFRLTPEDEQGVCDGSAAYEGGVAAPNGLAYYGEVEDYRVSLNPTAITLQNITATSRGTNSLALALFGLLLLASLIYFVILRRRETRI